jgi:hypothetical protein
MDPQEEKDTEMEFQDAKRAVKDVYGHSDSESSDNEHRKVLHVMFEGSWAITSRRVVKTLHREIAAVTPAPKATSLCHYFQAHKISVVTSYPLRAVLQNPNATGNIAKWAATLTEFELDFIPRHTVKS